jgi:hypothetical protein
MPDANVRTWSRASDRIQVLVGGTLLATSPRMKRRSAPDMTGSWLLLVSLAFVTSIGCGKDSCSGPHPSCPYYVGFTVSIPDGGAASGVQATISGGGSFSCGPTATGASCFGNPVLPGQLQVTAPGFQTIDVSATLTITPASPCSCQGLTLEPSNVTLRVVMPDGGLDAPEVE